MNSGPEPTSLSTSHGLPAAYTLIESDLREVEAFMLRELESETGFINEVIRYGFRLGGKRLRPALVLLVAKAMGGMDANHYRCAAALEMIHTATLIHDDILDGAKVRRHLETLNIRWNSAIGVLAGDVLFTRAMRLTTLSDDVFEYRTIAEATRATCEAELQQIGSKGNFELTRDEYYELIRGKTAALLSCACVLGAHYSPHRETVPLFAEFGEKLGMAFQIVDDVLDLVGQESVAGKTLGTDLAEGKTTLPLILYFQTACEKERTELLSLLRQENKSDPTISEIVGRLTQSGSVERARQTAHEIVREAILLLDSPQLNTTDPAAIDGLKNIAKYVIERDK